MFYQVYSTRDNLGCISGIELLITLSNESGKINISTEEIQVSEHLYIDAFLDIKHLLETDPNGLALSDEYEIKVNLETFPGLEGGIAVAELSIFIEQSTNVDGDGYAVDEVLGHIHDEFKALVNELTMLVTFDPVAWAGGTFPPKTL